MNAWICVLVLAVVQGVTEFLPVSSSGHLLIGKQLLGLDSPGVRFAVILHVGTLVAVCAYFWRRLRALALGALKGEKAAWGMVGFLALATVPAAVMYKVCGRQLKSVLDDPVLAACGLIVTGVGLLSLWRVKAGTGEVTWWRALLMGIGQAVAILPGISRSGTTVLLGRHSRATPEAAGEFSMLMSIPIILGAALVDLMDTEAGGNGSVTTAMYVVGALVAAAVGYAAIGIFMRVLKSAYFWMFGVYCVVAGCVALAVL